MNCTKCNKELVEGAKFCPDCGTETVVDSTPVETQEVPQGQSLPRENDNKEGKKVDYKKLTIGLAAALVVSVVGLGILLLGEGESPIATSSTSAVAKEMRLEAYLGEVALENNSEPKEVVTGSRLVTGDQLETFLESSAYISLDSAKALRVDETSQVAVSKEEEQLKVDLLSGSLFFNVTEPLKDSELLEFHTNNVVTGVRGTSGIITYDENKLVTQVSIFTGTVTVTTTPNDPETVETAVISAGEVGVATTNPDGTVSLQVHSIENDPLSIYYSDLFVDTLQGDLNNEGDSVLLSDAVRKPQGVDFIPYEFEFVGAFSQGMAPVKRDGKWGYINEQGELVVDYVYDMVAPFWEDYAIVGTFTHTEDVSSGFSIDAYSFYDMKLLNLQGEELAVINSYASYGEPSEDKVRTNFIFHNGYANQMYNITHRFGQSYVIDQSGTQVAYSNLSSMSPYNDGYVVGSGGSWSGWGYYTMVEGEIVETWYSNGDMGVDLMGAYGPSDGLVWAESPDGYRDNAGFMNFPELTWTMTPAYTELKVANPTTTSDFFDVNGVAIVSQNNLWGGIDRNGNVMIPMIYEELDVLSEGRMAVKADGLWGYMDENQQMIIAPEYDAVSPFSGGTAFVLKGESVTVINKEGTVLQDNIPIEPYFTRRSTYEPYTFVTTLEPQTLVAVKEEATGLLGFTRVN